jgi:WhiB family redox-sensing transcriptional regulator
MAHWTEHAACRGLTEVMFPVRGDWRGVERAKAICASCPVIDNCLDFVSRNPERYGVWAGIAGKEITEERKRRQIIPNKAKHGTRSKYVSGCRCEHCTAANTAHKRKTSGTYVAL